MREILIYIIYQPTIYLRRTIVLFKLSYLDEFRNDLEIYLFSYEKYNVRAQNSILPLLAVDLDEHGSFLVT